MDPAQTLALTAGVAWGSGINLYATVLVVGFLGMTGDIVLPEELEILSHPLVLAAAAVMYCIEFFADKIPGVDTGWDALHTFIRIPAGAVLAAGAVGDVSAPVELAALLAGGSLAAGSHALKAGSRVLINTSPEPFTNWTASVSEDVAVVAGLWAALHYPWFFLAALLAFVLLGIWLLPKLWRAIVKVFAFIGRLFGGGGGGGRSGGGAGP